MGAQGADARAIADRIAKELTNVALGELGAVERLRAALEEYRANRGIFPEGKPAPPAPPPAEGAETSSAAAHVTEWQDTHAVIAGAAYAPAGARYIQETASRNQRYADFWHLASRAAPAQAIAGAARFPGGPVFNFNPRLQIGVKRCGQRYPYRFQAHHLVPKSVYKKMPADLVEILKKSDYDINHGSNIILLPAGPDHTLVHALPCHFSDHPDYSKLVARRLQQLERKMREIAAKRKPHEDAPAKVAEFLRSVHDECWDLVSSIGWDLATVGNAKVAEETGLVNERGKLG